MTTYTIDHNDRAAIKWLVDGETGISSRCLCAALLGIRPKWIDVPHDPDDFRRCALFMELLDESGKDRALYAARQLSDTWYRLVEKWDELDALYRRDKDKKASPELYQALIALRH